jgi:sugar phosphate isomerase/epimerase
MGIKGAFPFRIGATSYVLAAGMLTNVRYLAGRVDDIELLVFESDAMAGLPDLALLLELGRIARLESLTYTVHLPLDICLGHSDSAQRERSIDRCVHTIERMAVVNPVAYILHCSREPGQGGVALPDAAWVEHTAESLSALLACGVGPESICVETLDGNFPLLEPVIRKAGVSVCLDIGHLILYGLDIFGYLERLGDAARVMHLHGVVDGKDHRSLSGVPRKALEKAVSALTTKPGKVNVVTLELFNESDFEESLTIMEGLASCTM